MIGKTISHYKILEKLGEGGMGIVYKAEDTKLERFVALKFLPPHLGQSEDEKKRFIHEAKAASALNHNNIGMIHEIDDTEDGQLFIVMAYYKGETLKDRIESHKAGLPTDETTDIAKQIAKGLAKAHSKEIIHRDIKPANILITEDGEVKIIDFGLAKLAGRTQLTKSGMTIGTVAYMSPEQAQGGTVGHRTDIWSLGVVFYEMLTGEQPFKGDYEQAVVYSIMNEEPEPLTGLRTGVPMELEKTINKCLAKEPSERYQHADDLIVDLRRMKKESTSKTIKLISPKNRQKRIQTFLVPAILLFTMISILAGYFFFSQEAESKERIPIAVVDFVNETDEPELNGLSGLLITALEQSRHLSVLTRSRMFDILKQLGKEDVKQIDESLGRKICEQVKVKAMVIASIRRLGNSYVIDLKALDPEGDKYLFTGKVEGEGQQSIFSMIDELAERARKELQEKEEDILASTQQVVKITTPNLEAYQHYFKGNEFISKLRFDEAQAEFIKAIALDSTFGLAYFRMAYTGAWGAGVGIAIERDLFVKKHLQKAFAFIDKIPERERYLLQAEKARVESGYAAAIPVLREMERHYPQNKEMLICLADYAFHSEKYDLASEYFDKVLEIDPTVERAYQHLIFMNTLLEQFDKTHEYARRFAGVNKKEAYMTAGRIYWGLANVDSASHYYKLVLEIDSSYVNAIKGLVNLYNVGGHYEKMLLYANQYVSVFPSVDSYLQLGDAYIKNGQFKRALESLEKAQKLSPRSLWVTSSIGWNYWLMDERDKARGYFKKLFEPDRPTAVQAFGYWELGMMNVYDGKYKDAIIHYEKAYELFLQANDPRRATWMAWQTGLFMLSAEGLNKYPLERSEKILKTMAEMGVSAESSLMRFFNTFHMILQGQFALADSLISEQHSGSTRAWLKGVMDSVRKECAQAEAYAQQAFKANPGYARISLLYHLAQCQYESGYLDKALQNIQNLQLINDGYWTFRAIYYPKSFYLMGKIYEKKGETKLAIQSYEKFLKIWKEADNDLPELIDANARFVKLKEMTTK